MSETGDIQHATEQAATDDGTPSVPMDQSLLTPSLLTTDLMDDAGTVPATREGTEGQIEGVEVYGDTPADAPTGLQARQKRKPKPRKPAATLNIRQSAFVSHLTNPDSDTFGNKVRSAVKAGYSEENAYELTGIPGVRNAIEQQLAEVNASSKVRLGVVAQILHKQQHVTEQYDKDGNLSSRTVVDNDKHQLAAAKELARLDGSYHKAALVGHANRKVLDAALSQWTKRLRASLAPQTSASVGDTQDVLDVEGSVVDGIGQPDALAGQGSSLEGTAGAGTDAADGGEGG